VSLLRSPLIHFLLLGALLFFGESWRSSLARARQAETEVRRIEIDAEQVDQLRRDFASQLGRFPDGRELDRMIATAVDEAILYREALERGMLERDGGVQTRLIQKMLFLEGRSELEDAGGLLARARELGLDRDDVVVRRILVQKMRLLGSSLPTEERASEADIRTRYERERESLREADRMSAVHVFLSSDRRAGRSAEEARTLRERLEREGLAPDEAIGLGDPFPLGHRLERRSARDLTRRFGKRFGPSAMAQPTGRWSEPIESAYGHHLLWVEATFRGEVPPLETVAERLRHSIDQERGEARLEAFLADLRTRYEVAVDRAAPAPLAREGAKNENARVDDPGERVEAG
jgi:hypothetical protein